MTSAAFSYNAKFIATTNELGNTRVWDVHTGQNLLTYFGPRAYTEGVMFGPDGGHVLTRTPMDGSAVLYHSEAFMTAKSLIELASRRALATPLPKSSEKTF